MGNNLDQAGILYSSIRHIAVPYYTIMCPGFLIDAAEYVDRINYCACTFFRKMIDSKLSIINVKIIISNVLCSGTICLH